MAVTLVFKDNFLNFKEYSKVSLRFTFRAKPFMYVLILPFISILYFWFHFIWEKDATLSSIWANTGFYVWFMSLLIFSMPFTTWRGLKKNYAAARFMQSPVDYQFSDEGMDMKSTVTQLQMTWQAFHSFYDFGRYGVLISGNSSGFFLDFESLQLPSSKSDFLSIIKNHQIPIK